MRNFLYLILTAALLLACAAPEALPPPPTPQALTISLTAATRTWQPALQACASQQPGLSLRIQETPTFRFDLGDGLAVRLGVPSQTTPYFAAQIGEEQITVVVHSSNPLQELTQEELRLLFTGQLASWDSLVSGYNQPVQVWSYPPTEELPLLFSAALWNVSPPDILAYMAPDPGAMLEAIAENPGAIGYLPSSWLIDSQLKPVQLEPELQTALQQPVLLISAQEPQSLDRNLVSCLQISDK